MNKNHNLFVAVVTFVAALFLATGCIMPVGPGAGQMPPSQGGGLPPMATPPGMVLGGFGGGPCSVAWPNDKTFILKNDSPRESMKYASLQSNLYRIHPCDMQKVIQFGSAKVPAGSVGPMLLVPPGFHVRYITDFEGTADVDVVIYEWKRGFDLEPRAVGMRGLWVKTPWLGSDTNGWYVHGNWKPLNG